jgi:hypothetical protein
MGQKRNAYSILVGKPEGKKRLEISRPRWDDNIKMVLNEWEDGMVWTELIRLRTETSGGLL